MAKSKSVRVGSTTVTGKKHETIQEKINSRHARLRSTYQEIHGKVVDWVSHSFEDDSLFVSIRFTDKTEFSLQFSLKIQTDSIDLADMSTGNFEMIREYYRRQE